MRGRTKRVQLSADAFHGRLAFTRWDLNVASYLTSMGATKLMVARLT